MKMILTELYAINEDILTGMTLSLSLSLPLPLFLSHSLFLLSPSPRSLFLSHSLTHSFSLTLSLTLSLLLTHSLSSFLLPLSLPGEYSSSGHVDELDIDVPCTDLVLASSSSSSSSERGPYADVLQDFMIRSYMSGGRKTKPTVNMSM